MTQSGAEVGVAAAGTDAVGVEGEALEMESRNGHRLTSLKEKMKIMKRGWETRQAGRVPARSEKQRCTEYKYE